MDINCGQILDGTRSMDEMGEQIFQADRCAPPRARRPRARNSAWAITSSCPGRSVSPAEGALRELARISRDARPGRAAPTLAEEALRLCETLRLGAVIRPHPCCTASSGDATIRYCGAARMRSFAAANTLRGVMAMVRNRSCISNYPLLLCSAGSPVALPRRMPIRPFDLTSPSEETLHDFQPIRVPRTEIHSRRTRPAWQIRRHSEIAGGRSQPAADDEAALCRACSPDRSGQNCRAERDRTGRQRSPHRRDDHGERDDLVCAARREGSASGRGCPTDCRSPGALQGHHRRRYFPRRSRQRPSGGNAGAGRVVCAEGTQGRTRASGERFLSRHLQHADAAGRDHDPDPHSDPARRDRLVLLEAEAQDRRLRLRGGRGACCGCRAGTSPTRRLR